MISSMLAIFFEKGDWFYYSIFDLSDAYSAILLSETFILDTDFSNPNIHDCLHVCSQLTKTRIIQKVGHYCIYVIFHWFVLSFVQFVFKWCKFWFFSHKLNFTLIFFEIHKIVLGKKLFMIIEKFKIWVLLKISTSKRLKVNCQSEEMLYCTRDNDIFFILSVWQIRKGSHIIVTYKELRTSIPEFDC